MKLLKLQYTTKLHDRDVKDFVEISSSYNRREMSRINIKSDINSIRSA